MLRLLSTFIFGYNWYLFTLYKPAYTTNNFKMSRLWSNKDHLLYLSKHHVDWWKSCFLRDHIYPFVELVVADNNSLVYSFYPLLLQTKNQVPLYLIQGAVIILIFKPNLITSNKMICYLHFNHDSTIEIPFVSKGCC